THFMNIRTIIAALLALLAVSLAGLASASAHYVTPTSASPADGAILAQAPDKVILIFPEEAGEKTSFVQVFDQQERQVDLGNGGVDLNDPKHATLVVKLPPALPQGVYLVKWKIGLSDNDSSQGQYYFGVGKVTLPADPPPAAPIASAPSTGQPVALWAAGAAILAAAAVAVVLYSRKAAGKR
ncbi:MAG TPA: copper resistance protein CopC, partial [Polyangia bacterium]